MSKSRQTKPGTVQGNHDRALVSNLVSGLGTLSA